MSRRQPISELPNLGRKSQAALAAAGIKTVAQLRRLGSVAAYARLLLALEQSKDA